MNPAPTLTPMQTRVALAIRDHRREFGFNPTMEAIAASLRRDKVSVYEHVEKLRRKGVLVTGERCRHRTLELTAVGAAMLPPPVTAGTRLPLLGRLSLALDCDVILGGFIAGTSLMTRFRRVAGGVEWLAPEFIPPRPCTAMDAVQLGVAAAARKGHAAVIVNGREYTVTAARQKARAA